jgi:hypothetical protein
MAVFNGHPGATAQLRQEFPVMEEVKPEELRDAPYPVAVADRPEEFFLEECGKVKRIRRL